MWGFGGSWRTWAVRVLSPAGPVGPRAVRAPGPPSPPPTLPHHCCLSLGSDRMVCTSSAPCSGGLLYMGRASACGGPKWWRHRKRRQWRSWRAGARAGAASGVRLRAGRRLRGPGCCHATRAHLGPPRARPGPTPPSPPSTRLHLTLHRLGLRGVLADDGPAAHALPVQAHVLGKGLREGRARGEEGALLQPRLCSHAQPQLKRAGGPWRTSAQAALPATRVRR